MGGRSVVLTVNVDRGLGGFGNGVCSSSEDVCPDTWFCKWIPGSTAGTCPRLSTLTSNESCYLMAIGPS